MAGSVLVVGLGGTIAMTSTAGGGVAPKLSAQQLVDAVPGLAATGIEVQATTFLNRPGASLGVGDLVELVRIIEASSAAGIVVVQGTDTIEESSYVLDLLHGGDRPVVVTGAMRNPTQAGADGPANLLAAVVIAASPEARGLGCLVVMADEIHAARRVRKGHSTSTAAFASPNGGVLGYLVEGRARFVNRVDGRIRVPLPVGSPSVGVCVATLGDDGATVGVLAERLDGLVVAGFGAGHVPEGWVDGLTAAAKRIPVVLASRTGAGPVLRETYGFAGSERDLLGRGLISSGYLDAYKARVLLHLTLAAGFDRERIAATFAVAGNG
ncbi:asparaginase [Actinoplanes sp. TRM 88003]|uniref:Asparaginase n=1 Tax=Paractinoplanes aksuensis TaxID=2939490 RepID=A0ABT1DRX0_9ACTN|nr:asparaginase [Actinoplanes aksuensis]MCO8273577.1 asparaginase [Actinoplanes aksuensis]